MARAFDGTNDEIRVAIGNCNITAAITMGLIFRRNDTAYNMLMGLHTSGGSGTYTMELEDNATGNKIDFSGNTQTDGITVVNADGWVLLLVSKATGTVAPRSHKYVYSTNTWTHRDYTSTTANAASAAGGTMRFGEWEDVDDFNGDIACAAIWNRVLTDGECETLPFTLAAWHASVPNGLWVFDQSLTTQNVVDLTGGGANQSGTGGTLQGTTVSTTSVPLFTYDDGAWTSVFEEGAAAPQDTPELRGYSGLLAARQMQQVLAQ